MSTITPQTTLSPAVINPVVNFIGTGLEINNLSPTYPGMEAHCTADYLNIFKKDHVYLRDAANQRWNSITGFKHFHNQDTEEAGGLFEDIFLENGYRTYIYSLPCPTWEQMVTEHGGSGIAFDYEDSVGLDLSNNLGDYVVLSVRGTEISTAHDLVWLAMIGASSGSNMSANVGVGMEKIQKANDPLVKVGLEACDTVGTARNWSFATANGTSRDSIGTSAPVSVSNFVFGHSIYLFSGNLARFFYDGGSSLPALAKTTNIPSSGGTELTNTWRMGYKNNSTSAKSLALCTLLIYGTQRILM